MTHSEPPDDGYKGAPDEGIESEWGPLGIGIGAATGGLSGAATGGLSGAAKGAAGEAGLAWVGETALEAAETAAEKFPRGGYVTGWDEEPAAGGLGSGDVDQAEGGDGGVPTPPNADEAEGGDGGVCSPTSSPTPGVCQTQTPTATPTPSATPTPTS
jgi:hypothetical protein